MLSALWQRAKILISQRGSYYGLIMVYAWSAVCKGWSCESRTMTIILTAMYDFMYPNLSRWAYLADNLPASITMLYLCSGVLRRVIFLADIVPPKPNCCLKWMKMSYHYRMTWKCSLDVMCPTSAVGLAPEYKLAVWRYTDYSILQLVLQIIFNCCLPCYRSTRHGFSECTRYEIHDKNMWLLLR